MIISFATKKFSSSNTTNNTTRSKTSEANGQGEVRSNADSEHTKGKNCAHTSHYGPEHHTGGSKSFSPHVMFSIIHN